MEQKPEMEQKPKSRFRRYCERHAYRPRSLLSCVVIIVLVIAALGYFSAQGTGVFSKVTALGLLDIGELATQAGYFTTVQTIDKSRNVLGIQVPGTQSRYVYSYDGTIKALCGGTLSATPISTCAGYHMICEIEKQNACEKADRMGDRLIRGLQESQQDIFHIVAHVSRFRQSRSVGNGKGDLQQLRQALREHGLPAAGGTDQKDVALLQFHLILRRMEDPLVVVIHSNGEYDLRLLLADHILVQIGLDLHGFGQLLKYQRQAVIAGNGILLGNILHDAHAHPDAVITDIAAVARDQTIHQ